MRLLVVCAFLLICVAPARADTASGIAAYERGDYATALRELEPAAKSGDAAAQATYGLMLVEGSGVAKDKTAAVSWFRKSAEQGYARGQYYLGVAYDFGDAGAVDLQQAAEWYRKSAEQGYPPAQYSFGHMLINGDGVSADKPAGAEWVRKAAEQNSAAAAYYLSILSVAGNGVDKNALAGRFWMRRAKELGHPKAHDAAAGIDKIILAMESEGVPKTDGGDGASPERAILLSGAKTEDEGVKAEHAIVAAYFREWKWGAQSLINTPDLGIYDRISLQKPDGTTKAIYFNIANWFGKME